MRLRSSPGFSPRRNLLAAAVLAALGAPANINVLTTYIFKLTAWSPPLYNTAAAVAILLMFVTAILVWAQQRILSGKSFATVAGKAFRPRSLNLGPWRWFTFGLALTYLFVVVLSFNLLGDAVRDALDPRAGRV